MLKNIAVSGLVGFLSMIATGVAANTAADDAEEFDECGDIVLRGTFATFLASATAYLVGTYVGKGKNEETVAGFMR